MPDTSVLRHSHSLPDSSVSDASPEPTPDRVPVAEEPKPTASGPQGFRGSRRHTLSSLAAPDPLPWLIRNLREKQRRDQQRGATGEETS